MTKIMPLLLCIASILTPASVFAQTAKNATVPFPPIPEGYYSFGLSCAQAIAAGRTDDPPDSLAWFTRKSLSYGLGGGPVISKFEALGNGRYKVQARSYGNGDDSRGTVDNFTITIIDAKSFLMDSGIHNAVQYTHCPNVPKSIREDWFEF